MILRTFVLAAALAGCATAPSTPSTRAVVEQLFEAFNRHDGAALEALYAPDATHLSPELCAPRQGPQAIVAIYRGLFETLPDVHDSIDELVVEGDRAALRFTARANPGGRPFEMKIAAFIEVRDGRIVREQTFYDAPGNAGARPCTD